MISILKIKSLHQLRGFFLAVILLFLVCSNQALAQSPASQTISVSPTLFEMKAAPGQNWQSELRVINVNNYPMTIYLQVVDFAPLDETGRVDLLFNDDNENLGSSTLATWIDITRDPIIIPPQQTKTIPFSVIAPANAPPGGHYAAILVGTKPPVSDGSSSQVQTAQFVTSLLFVRVDGNIVEQGQIRSFATNYKIIQNPEATFALRFENTGNVYIQPQGDIEVFNMWGTKRGTIPINHQTHYGRVVQNSIREFIFTWKGEPTLFDIGRYKAVATLGYGESQKKFTTSTTYFWIIPFQQILIGLLVLGVIFLFVGWIVRLYIRRMLTLAGIDPTQKINTQFNRQPQTLELKHQSAKYEQVSGSNILAPLKAGVLDIKNKLKDTNQTTQWFKTIFTLLISYRLFIIAVVGIITILIIGWLFISAMFNDNKQYEVTILTSDAPVKLTSEEVYYESIAPKLNPDSKNIINQNFVLTIINRSGTLGVGAKTRVKLEEKGYRVDKLGAEIGESVNRTVIVYHPYNQDSALALSQALDGALLSANETQTNTLITVYTGTDLGQP